MDMHALWPQVAAAFFLTVGGVAEAEDIRANVMTAYEEVIKNPNDARKFDKYISTLPTDGEYYVVEGDILKTKIELRTYLWAQSSPIPARTSAELIIARYNGDYDYLKDSDSRKLSYLIDRKSFSKPSEYDAVVTTIRTATDQWENACSLGCNIKFEHKGGLDDTPDPTKVTFIVRAHNAHKAYVAASFFPSTHSSRKFINIDPSFYSNSVERVGILRHVLGHILGYRHQHINGIPGCFQVDEKWQPLTQYVLDPSVMHYYCTGSGNPRFLISDSDKQGHQRLYGQGS